MTERTNARAAPLVAIRPVDLEGVKELLGRFSGLREGETLSLTKVEAELMRKYFPDFTLPMLKDLAEMWESKAGLREAQRYGLARHPDHIWEGSEGNIRLRGILEKLQAGPKLTWAGIDLGKEGSTSSPTIDRGATFALPRFWWLRPWSAVRLLQERCDTLADVYDSDMKAAAEQARQVSAWDGILT